MPGSRGDALARNVLTAISCSPSPSGGASHTPEEPSRELVRELQADNDELRETNRQLIAAMEEVQCLNVTLQSVNEALHTANVQLRAELELSRTRVFDLEHMLNGIGIAAVLLNDSLEMRGYNAAASRFFTLGKQDIGRPISRLRHEFPHTSVAELCREALDSGEPCERLTTVSGGALVTLRAREVDLDGCASGLMLTVSEVSERRPEPATRSA